MGVRVTSRESLHRYALVAVLACAAALAGLACGRGASKPPPTAAPLILTVRNETPCIIHVRFDNGFDSTRVSPGATAEIADPRLAEYSYIQVESTMAIFHTYGMAKARADGYTLTVRPAMDDHPCVEQPP